MADPNVLFAHRMDETLEQQILAACRQLLDSLAPGQFDRIAPGDILVTRSTDPGWTPIFGRLGGLIMERGGQLSHGSVVAREYGLPAVVGTPDITAHLRDGDPVLLDGLTGTVVLKGRR
jgi:phosphoenolpyruvate synthase/pyruvate phosphate dikinase